MFFLSNLPFFNKLSTVLDLPFTEIENLRILENNEIKNLFFKHFKLFIVKLEFIFLLFNKKPKIYPKKIYKSEIIILLELYF